MTDIRSLTHAEKVFLAGSMRDLLCEDSAFTETEMKDLDSLSRRLHFHDFAACLDEYEKSLPDDDDAFRNEAKKITDPRARRLILDALYELEVRKPTPENERDGVFGTLTALWQPAK